MLNASSISLYMVLIVQDIVRTWPLDLNPNVLARLPLTLIGYYDLTSKYLPAPNTNDPMPACVSWYMCMWMFHV